MTVLLRLALPLLLLAASADAIVIRHDQPDARRAENRLVQTDGAWLRYVFDCRAGAPPLGGATAGGDSGGPVTIEAAGLTVLAGVTHGLDGTPGEVKHIVQQMQDDSLRMGVCGQRFAAAPVGFYADWIERTIGGD